MTAKSENEITITVNGPGVRPGRIQMGALILIGDALQKAIQRVTLVLQSGSSVHHGPLPNELRELLEIELSGLEAGSVKLTFMPAGKHLPSNHAVHTAFDTIVAGIEMVSVEGGGMVLPVGFDYGVVQALQPLAALPTRYGIDSLTLRAPSGKRNEARLSAPEWEQFMRLEPPPRERERRVVGRLLMADFKNYSCRIYDTRGTSHFLPFDPSLDPDVKAAMKRWVEVAVSEPDPESDQTADEATRVIGLALLSDEEADEYAAPRRAPWPQSVIDTMKTAAENTRAALEKRPRLREYQLED